MKASRVVTLLEPDHAEELRSEADRRGLGLSAYVRTVLLDVRRRAEGVSGNATEVRQ